MSDLVDTLERTLADIDRTHPHATRRFRAERLAKAAADHAGTNGTVVPQVLCVHPLSESELLATEARRMRDQINDLRDTVAKLRAEKGEL